jgi:hypothetical protein
MRLVALASATALLLAAGPLAPGMAAANPQASPDAGGAVDANPTPKPGKGKGTGTGGGGPNPRPSVAPTTAPLPTLAPPTGTEGPEAVVPTPAPAAGSAQQPKPAPTAKPDPQSAGTPRPQPSKPPAAPDGGTGRSTAPAAGAPAPAASAPGDVEGETAAQPFDDTPTPLPGSTGRRYRELVGAPRLDPVAAVAFVGGLVVAIAMGGVAWLIGRRRRPAPAAETPARAPVPDLDLIVTLARESARAVATGTADDNDGEARPAPVWVRRLEGHIAVSPSHRNLPVAHDRPLADIREPDLD